MRAFLVELNCTRGTTVLLTTHDLVDVERLCDRLVIIDHGRLIEDSTVDRDQATLRHGTHVGRRPRGAGSQLSVDGVRVTKVEGPRQWLQFHRDEWTAAALLERVAAQAPVRDLSVEEPAIEDIVRAIYRGETSESV